MNAHQTHALMVTVLTHLVPITASAMQVSRELLPSKLALVRKFASHLLTLYMFWALFWVRSCWIKKRVSNTISVNPNSCYTNQSSSSGLPFHLIYCLLMFIHYSVISVTWPGNSPARSSTIKSGNRLLVQQMYAFVCVQVNVWEDFDIFIK